MKWKDLSKKEKIKKIAKYTVNGLNMINMLLLGLSKIWGWEIANISATIIVFTGAISEIALGEGIGNTSSTSSTSSLFNN